MENELILNKNIVDVSSVFAWNPFKYECLDDLMIDITSIVKAYNGFSIKLCYAIGQLAQDSRLKQKFGLTVEELAHRLNISPATFYRYRLLSTIFTTRELEQFSERMLSCKTITSIAEFGNKRSRYYNPELFEVFKDKALSGTIDAKALSDARDSCEEVCADAIDLLGASFGISNMLPEALPFDSDGCSIVDVPAIPFSDEIDDLDVGIDRDPTAAIKSFEDSQEPVDTKPAFGNADYDLDPAERKPGNKGFQAVLDGMNALNRDMIDYIQNAESQVDIFMNKLGTIPETDVEMQHKFDEQLEAVVLWHKSMIEKALSVYNTLGGYGVESYAKLDLPEGVEKDTLFN